MTVGWSGTIVRTGARSRLTLLLRRVLDGSAERRLTLLRGLDRGIDEVHGPNVRLAAADRTACLPGIAIHLILARLERLERDYRRSRFWNRLALLAVLVVVTAGFAQQDPKLPDVINCERPEATSVRAATVTATDLPFATSLEGGDAVHKDGATFNVRVGRAVSLSMHASNVDGKSPEDKTPGLSRATFGITGNARSAACVAFQTHTPARDPVGLLDSERRHKMLIAGCDNETGANVLLQVDGINRTLLGSIEGTDKLGRAQRYPESTLTLLDKDGKFLEQLPR